MEIIFAVSLLCVTLSSHTHVTIILVLPARGLE